MHRPLSTHDTLKSLNTSLFSPSMKPTDLEMNDATKNNRSDAFIIVIFLRGFSSATACPCVAPVFYDFNNRIDSMMDYSLLISTPIFSRVVLQGVLRVWLLLSNVLGPGIYKPDPAGEFTKRNLGETVSANLFSTVIFGPKYWPQKVESSHCCWETKESWAWTPNFLVISWCTGVFWIVVRAGISDSHRR